ncbi:MAG: hypothetical protein IT425_09650 [Pirellulales bacterium]|nr:hypothetical protein [Pirellulales bacterium]
MLREELIEMLAERPFSPLCLHMSNGRTHEIRHPENAIVGDYHIALLVVRDEKELIRIISLPHVNEVEPLPSDHGTKNGNGKRRKSGK